ncbi:helix-turn-helix domain-containing protein [Micromonospora sp. CA-269861]|uniref:AraC-like ligand-binding domain-containing protein n=1 Tax=Micromonospora sp. CA-269861 TaxID=3239968 RepID=UPI003D942944
MHLAQFRTADLPAGDRFDAWHEMTSNALISTVVTTESVDDFTATVKVLDLGAVQLSTVSYPPLRATRTARIIRRSDPDLYYVSLPLRGRLGVRHVGRDADIDTDHFVVIDTSQPGVVVNSEPVKHLIVQVPRAELPFKPSALNTAVARPLPIGGGIGALLVNVAQQMMGSVDAFRPAEGMRLANVVVDLVTSVLAGHLHNGGAARDAAQRLLQRRIFDFIETRLPDQALSPSVVAAAHNISVRYLQLLFQDQGLTVSGWIRERRLDRCRRDLRDPALAGRPVHAIGARWGLPDPTAFNRAFKQAFGVPPGDYRRQQLELEGCADGQGVCAQRQ